MVLQSRYASLSLPHFEVVPVQQLGRPLIGFLVIGAIQLVNADDAPLIIKKRGNPWQSFPEWNYYTMIQVS